MYLCCMSNKGVKIKIRANFPFDPAKWPFFYGWVILFAGSIGMVFSTPGQTIGVSVFTENLKNSLSLNGNQLTLAYMFGTIGSSLFLTRIGRLYDQYGARIILILASVFLGLVLWYLTLVDNLAMFFKIKYKIDTVWPIMILISFGFFGIRFLGQGTLTMVSRNMVMKWFEKRRERANLILGATVSLGFSLAPKLFYGLIKKHGWENAWIIIGGVIATVFTLFVIIFFRDNPEDSGLKPDGNSNVEKARKRKIRVVHEFQLKEVKRTYVFWVINLSLALNGFLITAFTFWIESIYETAGYNMEKAISYFMPTALISVSFSIIFNLVSEHIKLRNALYVNTLGLIIACIGILNLSNNVDMHNVIIIGMGMMNGTFAVISALAWPRFFGLKYLGEVSGYAMSFLVFGTGIAPFFFSKSKSIFQSYNPAVFVCLVIGIVLFFMSFKATTINENELML